MPATQLSKAGLAGTATVPERVGTGGVGEGERRPPGTRWVAAGAVGAFWHSPAAPAPFSPVPCPAELSASDDSSLSDAVLLEEGKGAVGTGGGEQCPPGVPSIPTHHLSRRGDAAVGTCHPAGVPIPRGTR